MHSRMELKLSTQHRSQKSKYRPKYSLQKLRNPPGQEEFQNDVTSRLAQIGGADAPTVSDHSESLKGALTGVAKEKLGLMKKRNQDSAEHPDLLGKKRDTCVAACAQLKSARLTETHKEVKVKVQRKTGRRGVNGDCKRQRKCST